MCWQIWEMLSKFYVFFFDSKFYVKIPSSCHILQIYTPIGLRLWAHAYSFVCECQKWLPSQNLCNLRQYGFLLQLSGKLKQRLFNKCIDIYFLTKNCIIWFWYVNQHLTTDRLSDISGRIRFIVGFMAKMLAINTNQHHQVVVEMSRWDAILVN